MSLSSELKSISLGEHLCSIYRSKEEQMSIIVPFIINGLRRNEKCLYILDENTKEGIIKEFKKHIEIRHYIESGQMIFLTKEETYLKNGFFDPDRMIQLLKDAEREAIESGYSGLRVTGEMTWVFTKLPGVERLVEYEAKLNHFFPKSNCVAICQYNEEKFDPEILAGVIYTHPKLILYDALVENPYYIPPDVFLLKVDDFRSGELYKILVNQILEKTKIDERMKRSKDLIYSTIKSIPSATFVVNLKKRITFWNPAAERITGLKGEDVIGKECTEVLKSVECQQKCNLFENNSSASLIVKCRINNSTKWFLKSVNCLRDENGTIIGGIESFQDLTDKIEIEEELRKSEEKYRELWENSNDIIFLLDTDGYFIDLNKMALETFGYSKDEIRKISILDLLDERYHDFAIEKIREIVEHKQPSDVLEFLGRTREGREIWIEVRARPIVDKGKVTAIQGIARDITERKRLERSLSDLNDILRLLNKILRHDILNDLSAIRIAIELFLETEDKELLRKVLRRIDRSTTLIKQMQKLEDLTKFRELKAVRIQEILDEVCKKYTGVKINIHGDGVVEANEALASVFDNIIGNSVKHGKADRIEIRIEGNDFYEIRIIDNGRGIPDEIKTLIFNEGFSYGDAKGSGLGLYISKKIIEAYGGTIEVEKSKSETKSEETPGAEFIIRLKKAKP
jgi:PAS domain S-box-containing protein